MNKNTIILIAVTAIGLLVLMVSSTLSLGGYKVEICKEFQGRQACGTAVGSSETDAMNTATQVACAQISSGMTESTQCQAGNPVKVTWLNPNPAVGPRPAGRK
ncbi:MAG: hypothetical protein FJW30_02165 [Acidobacteria bacterium]|nr:hypothetical protein [Acidobacteriota bacterium]